MVKKGSTKATKGKSTKDNVQITEAVIESQKPVIEANTSQENDEASSLTKRELLFRQKLFDSIGIKLPEHYDESFVKTIYEEQIKDEDKAKIQNLEVIGYLENYLWKHFTPAVSIDHLLSILTLLNERSSHDDQSAPSFTGLLHSEEQKLPQFVDKLIDQFLEQEFDVVFAESLTCFLKVCVQAIDHKFVRNSVLRYFSLPIWYSVSSYRRELELENIPNLKNAWKMLDQHRVQIYQPSESQVSEEPSKKKKRKRNTGDDGKDSAPNPAIKMFEKDSQFIPKLLNTFYEKLSAFSEHPSELLLKFLVRNLELFIDLLSQYATRKYFLLLLEDSHFVVRAKCIPALLSNPLFSQLVKQLEELIHFPVNTQEEGQLVEIEEILEVANATLNQLQSVSFQLFPDKLKDLIFSSLGQLQKRENLGKFLCLLETDELLLLAKKLHLLEPEDLSQSLFKEKMLSQKDFLLSLFIDKYTWNHQFLKEKFQVYSLYPTEENLFDEHKIPFYSSSTLLQENPILALPKLNLQFLALEDYLWKNFQLFQSENYYSIREDIIDAVKRSGPKKLFNNSMMFHGWSRNALPILSMTVDEVARPKIGEVVPGKVISTITIDISRFSGSVLDEWESLNEHDVIFLISFGTPSLDYTSQMEEFEREKTLLESGSRPQVLKGSLKEEEVKRFLHNYGVQYIRGAEIFECRDELNNVLAKSNKQQQSFRSGTKRSFRVKLDPVQYYHDIKQGKDCYDNFHLFVKRDPRENNFKAILETIKNLYLKHSLQNSLPAWMKNPLLGIGDTKAAHFRSLEADTTIESENFVDTFLDVDHIKEAFPAVKDIVIENPDNSVLTQPFRLEIQRAPIKEGDLQSYYGIERIVVRPYQLPSRGPYPENARLQNSVRFTSQQVQAIRSGMRKGLSVVVGPPGTGKTDVTVQLISNLYHNYPNQRILVVTHSNAALNDIFEKIMKKDIHPRHLIRLGSGEADLRENVTTSSVNPFESAYSKQGRVDWCLMRRIQLLAQVQRLSMSLEQLADNGANCETASFFYSSVIAVKINKFRELLKSKNFSSLQEIFPFKAFFQDVTDLFSSDEKKDLEKIESCLNYIENIFTELADYRPLEFLRTGTLRCDYLLMNQARIVAMTCTHAAIMRDYLVEQGFKYDSLIMEEAAQILEIETFIPMCLQKMEGSSSSSSDSKEHRLKRIVLLGDHYQLPPIIQNQSLQRICHFHQSMFTRLLRLGYPSLSLTHQGRSRKELVSLFNWRYSHSLTHLPSIETLPEYSLANPGFYYPFQLIDVPYYQQKGESLLNPSQHSSFQNLGEAEYLVAVFQYMCLLGYPSEKISILTTYQAQKQLIREILRKRCLYSNDPNKKNIFGKPKHITTIDKFQGQQNDYILVSLVRTDHIGYLKDIHRLIVFLSRARFGLYVFGHHSLFEKCPTWFPILSRFDHHPNRLTLVAGESFQNKTRVQSQTHHQEAAQKDNILEIDGVSTMGILVYQMTQQAQAAQKK